HLAYLTLFLLLFFHEPSNTASLPLSLHDALPISCSAWNSDSVELEQVRTRQLGLGRGLVELLGQSREPRGHRRRQDPLGIRDERSEEHTSELQSRGHLVCRLLLEKKKKNEQNQPQNKKDQEVNEDIVSGVADEIGKNRVDMVNFVEHVIQAVGHTTQRSLMTHMRE